MTKPDATAAARARAYRARKRDVTDRHAVELGELVAAIHELVAELRADRDGSLRHVGPRDVTVRHGGEGAPGHSRVSAATRALSGPRVAASKKRDVVTELAERVETSLGRLAGGASPQALADEFDAPVSDVIEALVWLQSAGLVRRIPAAGPTGRDFWVIHAGFGAPPAAAAAEGMKA